MSYEGYTEYKCACGGVESYDVYEATPTKCKCGLPLIERREVDQTNDPAEYGDWVSMTPTATVPESFCDQVLARPDVKTAIADEAKRIVSGARRSAYGKPEDNFERIAAFWTAYMRNTGREVDITAADVSPMMILMKLARICETPDHRDSWVDAAGYVLTGAEVNGVAA